MVQMSPARPVYAEHSFSTWNVPFLGDPDDKPSLVSWLGAVLSEQAVRTMELTTVAMMKRLG